MDAITETFSRDTTDSAVMVLDGHRVEVKVSNGHLILSDGMCGDRRERRLSRVERTVKRIVIIGHSGHVTLQAYKWIQDINYSNTGRGHRSKNPLSLLIVSPTGDLLASSASAPIDAKLRRAQCHIADRPEGLAIVKRLCEEKFRGHARVIEGWDSDDWCDRLATCTTIDECRALESWEAVAYFDAWREQGCRVHFAPEWSPPEHWLKFKTRGSPLSDKANRNAVDPINALLNYCYGIAKSEATIACYIHGLDPDLGIMHQDYIYRHTFAFDIVEAVRPTVEKFVLNLIQQRTFTRDSFHEEGNGILRVLRPLTHECTEQAMRWHQALSQEALTIKKDITATIEGWRPQEKRAYGTAKKGGPKPKLRTSKPG